MCDKNTGRNKRKYAPPHTHTNFNHIMIILYGTGEVAIQPEEGLKIIQRRGWTLFFMILAYYLRLMKKMENKDE